MSISGGTVFVPEHFSYLVLFGEMLKWSELRESEPEFSSEMFRELLHHGDLF
jgi:hypothetical protein